MYESLEHDDAEFDEEDPAGYEVIKPKPPKPKKFPPRFK